MKTFDHDLQLRWTQPSAGKRLYELRDITGALYGALEYQNRPDNKPIVDAPGARFAFDRKQTWREAYVTVTSIGTGQEVARFDYGAWMVGGTLTFANGAQYQWKSSTWGNKFSWVTMDNAFALGFAVGGIIQPNADVHFDAGDPRSMVLIFLGWYLYTLLERDWQ